MLGTAGHLDFSADLTYEFSFADDRTARWSRPMAPALVSTLIGLATFPGLPLRDRRRMLSFMERTWEDDPPLALDLESRSARDWLSEIGQSPEASHLVWAPLARFLLGHDLGLVSARMFVAVLSRCFLSDRQSARLALPLMGMSSLLLAPSRAFLKQHDVVLHEDTVLERLQIDGHEVTGLRTAAGNIFTADWIVAALPHHRLTRLLPERILTRYAYFQQLTALHDSPALVVHLLIEHPMSAPRLLLLADHMFHWLTSRQISGSATPQTLVSLVMIREGAASQHEDQVLLEAAMTTVARTFALPRLPKVLFRSVLRISRAFQDMGPGTSSLRPISKSPLDNLFLGGGWTDTGLPSGLESEIRSGDLCAAGVMDAAT
jgi:phytoene dehydrogenase-like protein